MHKPILNCWEKTGSSDLTEGAGLLVESYADKVA